MRVSFEHRLNACVSASQRPTTPCPAYAAVTVIVKGESGREEEDLPFEHGSPKEDSFRTGRMIQKGGELGSNR